MIVNNKGILSNNSRYTNYNGWFIIIDCYYWMIWGTLMLRNHHMKIWACVKVLDGRNCKGQSIHQA